jgi:hypothetical protein
MESTDLVCGFEGSDIALIVHPLSLQRDIKIISRAVLISENEDEETDQFNLPSFSHFHKYISSYQPGE